MTSAAVSTSITCSNEHINALYPRIKGFLDRSISEYTLMGTRIRGYRTPDAPSIWIRDYSDMMRAFRYWEADMKSVAEHFAEMQSARGWLFDYVTMTPEKVPCEKENWAKYVRVPVEADVEYRFVNAVWLAWQATGDTAWLRRMFPHCVRALEYVRTDPWRWDASHELVKRAYTIDTWDFDYTAGRHPWLNFQITDDTYWGIMHGDNSGYYEAFARLAACAAVLGKKDTALLWRARADALRRRTNRLCFNGRFYAHRVPLTRGSIPGVDEDAQLSLSNPMDINRGLATHTMAASIIEEYRRRGAATGAFAEWFSIDPPFPAGVFGDEKIVPGAYCNGGIMPLVGGELARAAFEHGFERYAVEQLLRYEELTRDGLSYLWYFPDGRPASIETSTSPDASPADSWGSSAMLYALMEGLAGIVDTGRLFRAVTVSPRWSAAGCEHADVTAAYGASDGSFGYTYTHDAARQSIELVLRGRADTRVHLLLPAGTRQAAATRGGRALDCRLRRVKDSSYADMSLRVNGRATVRIEYR